MDDIEKTRVTELVMGFRKPTSGFEKHFLKVIKKEAMPCTHQEKEWLSYYEKTLAKGGSIRQLKWVNPTISASSGNKSNRYAPPVKDYQQSNMNLERLQAEKEDERIKQIINGPKPAPIEATKAELQKLKSVKNTTSYQIDEGIGGSREDNKKMRGQVWSEMLKRNKE